MVYIGTRPQQVLQASTKYFLSASTNFWKKIVRESEYIVATFFATKLLKLGVSVSVMYSLCLLGEYLSVMDSLCLSQPFCAFHRKSFFSIINIFVLNLDEK